MDWSPPPPPPGFHNAPSPALETAYDRIAIPRSLHPEPGCSASDAASVESNTSLTTASTITTTTTSTAAAADSNTSVETTPEPALALADDDDDTKHLTSAAQPPQGVKSDVHEAQGSDEARKECGKDGEATVVTRRRSQRIVKSTTTSTTTTIPSTPLARNEAVKPTTATSATVTRHSLRLSDKNKQSNGTVQATSATETRRTSQRLSNLAAAAAAAATPTAQGSKRSLEVMAAGSKSADAKLGGSYGKRVKLEEGVRKGKGAPDQAPTVVREKRKKVWLNQGLYVGQDQEFDPTLRPGSTSARKTRQTRGRGKKERPPTLPMPMFRGLEIMETQRDFKMPFNIYAPSPYVRPQTADWRKLNHNVFIGDASSYWKKEKPSNLKCVCEPTEGCNEHCLNRCTWLECDDGNCNIGRDKCKNRAFADLKERVKSGTKFAEGVEVMQTDDRGIGLRATRSFEPRQIIVEYTGEIITQEESERRMCEVYKNNKNYYLMLFDQNMILDATRGSVARFVNHSCEPNCRMEKWIVEGKPRMALFAGDEGIDAGDELTYDYNFNWFTGVDQQPCKCGSKNCRGTLGKRTDGPTTKKQQPQSTIVPERKKDAKKVKAGKAAAAAAAARKKAALEALAAKSKPAPTKRPLTLPPSARPGRGRPRKTENQTLQQRAAIYSPEPKSKRKPPLARRPPSPVREPSPSPAPTVSSTSEEEGDGDFELSMPRTRASTNTQAASARRRIGKPRITRTYKVNKTIAPTVSTRSITSQSTLDAAKADAFAEALKATEQRRGRGRPPKSRDGTPKSAASAAKRTRGRPPKDKSALKESEEASKNESEEIPDDELARESGEEPEPDVNETELKEPGDDEGDNPREEFYGAEQHDVPANTVGELINGGVVTGGVEDKVELPEPAAANIMNVAGVLNPVVVSA